MPFFVFSLSVPAQTLSILVSISYCECAACLFFFHALKTIGFAFCFRSLLFSVFLFFLQFFFSSVFLFFFILLFQFDNNYSQRWMFMWIDSVLIVVNVVWMEWMPAFFCIICRQLHTSVLCFAKWTATEHTATAWCTVFGSNWPLDSISIFSSLFNI